MDAEILLEIDVLDGLPDKSGRCLDLIEMFSVGYFIPMPEQAASRRLGGVHRREILFRGNNLAYPDRTDHRLMDRGDRPHDQFARIQTFQ